MNRTLSSSLIAIAALAVAGSAFGSTSLRPSIHVQPSAVAPGARVHVYGNAGSCSSDRLTLISAAFRGHAFGEGSLTARIHPDHTFSTRGRIRADAHAGRYSIGARCGGGNLGVAARLHVR